MTVPASLLVSSALCLGVSACVSPGLAFDVTFAVSLVLLARALVPGFPDGAFTLVDYCVHHGACLAVEQLIGIRARIARDVARRHPVVVPIYVLAVEQSRVASAIIAYEVDGRMNTAAIAKWNGFKDGVFAAFFWLRTTAYVINLVAIALFNIAFEEAKSLAPSVLGWRWVNCIRIIRSRLHEEKAETTWLLVLISVIVMYCMTTFTFFGCLAALFGFALMEAWRVYHLDSNHVADTANQGQGVDNAAGGNAEYSLRLAWESLWFLIILTYFSDVYCLYIVVGKRPLALASFAIFKITALTLARQVYLNADDGEEATGSGDGAQGETNKWHRAVMVVLTVESAKVFATYLFIDFFLGVVCFSSLCATAFFLFDKAIGLLGVYAPGNDENQDDGDLAMDLAGDTEDSGDDENQDDAGLAMDLAGDTDCSDNVHGRDSAGLARDLAGDADDVLHCQDCAALARGIRGDDEGSSDVHAEDHPSATAACNHEKETTTDEQPSDVSDSEVQAEDEEPGCNSSSSMDDWSHVGVDPTMPTDVNGGAGWNFSFFSMRLRR